jgi:hypothetical protein
MPNAEQMLEWAKKGDVKQTVAEARREANRRGHGQQTAYAGAGGLLGGILGSFRGPQGAAFGAFLGALLGALFGRRRDRAPRISPVTSQRKMIDTRPREVIRRHPQPARDYVEVMYSD